MILPPHVEARAGKECGKMPRSVAKLIVLTQGDDAGPAADSSIR